MMMISETNDCDSRPQHNLQEPQASLDAIASALNQSRPHMAGLARGLHSNLNRSSHGRFGGIHHLGLASGAESSQERVDWVSIEKGVSGSVKEMGSFSIFGGQDLLEKQLGVKNKGLLALSKAHLGKFGEARRGGAMEVSGNADVRSCLELHNAGAKMVYDKCSLTVRVIDETALLETVFAVPKPRNGSAKESEQEKVKQQLRGKGKGARKAFDLNRRCKNLVHVAKARGGAKRVYSRKEMEVLRFVGVAEQQKMWKGIYAGLGPSVAREYNDLASARQVSSFDPRQQQPYGKSQAPGILGAAGRGRGCHTNVFVH